MSKKEKTKSIKIKVINRKRATEEALQLSNNATDKIMVKPNRIKGFGIMTNLSFYDNTVRENSSNLWISFLDNYGTEILHHFEIYPEDAEEIRKKLSSKKNKEVEIRVKGILSSTSSLIEKINEESISDIFLSNILKKMGVTIVQM